MNRSTLLKALLALALLAAGAWYLGSHLEWRETPHHTGYSKAAQRNPLHAGLLLLRRLNVEAGFSEDPAELATFTSQGTLLLSNKLEHFATPATRDALLAWVERGGHLVLAIEATDRKAELLDALGIEIRGQLPGNRFRLDEANEPPHILEIEGHPLTVETGNGPAFRINPAEGEPVLWQATLRGQLDPDDEIPAFVPLEDNAASPQKRKRAAEQVNSNETLALFARYTYGRGTVTVGNFKSFENQSLSRHDHAALFVRLLTLPQGPRPVLMLQAPPYPRLPVWLLEHAPEALLAAALLLIAALWRAIPRFGPLLPEPLPKRPGLGEHLAASGRFLLREHSYEALIAPLRDEVSRLLEGLQHRHPEIEGRERLACHLSDISQPDIALAFSPEPLTRQDFLRRVRTLAALREHCLSLRQSYSGALS